jgi:hypothetical protein
MKMHDDIMRSTGLLFKDVDDFPSPLASCIFVKFGNSYFLITAAHVYDEGPSDLFIILPDKEITIGGELASTRLPVSGDRKDDKIDIAFIKIQDDIVNDISQRFKFIEIEEVGISHELQFNHNYFVFGFPATRPTHKMKMLKNIPTKIFSFWTSPLSAENYLKTKFKPHQNILLRFNKKEVFNKATNIKQKAPDIEGISGCGLWYISDPSLENTSKKLIGIITENDQNPLKKYLIATRIDVLTEAIRKLFKIDIPESNVAKVNLRKN